MLAFTIVLWMYWAATWGTWLINWYHFSKHPTNAFQENEKKKKLKSQNVALPIFLISIKCQTHLFQTIYRDHNSLTINIHFIGFFSYTLFSLLCLPQKNMNIFSGALFSKLVNHSQKNV
jgi:hypothetical protein